MSLHNNNPTRFYQTDSNSGPEIKSAQDILRMMDEDDNTEDKDEVIDLSTKKDKIEDKDDKNDKDDKEESEENKEEAINVKGEKEDEEDDLTEIEEELSDETIDLDDDEYVPMPRRKDILAKYPKFFEEFPGVERAYFRDQKFSEYFPTPKDAETAFEKARALDNFEQELLKGNSTTVLKVVKDEDPEAFNKIVDNYLPSLRQIDEKAYFHVVGTIIKGTIYNMIKEARDSSDETLQEAARILNKFVFNSEKWTPIEKLSKSDGTNKPDPREKELTKRQQEFETKQFQIAFNGIQSKVKNIFEKTIAKHIDPKNSMSSYTKKNASRDAHEELDRLLNTDTRFKQVLTKAWEKAREDNYSDDSMERVLKVIKSRASSLMPAVIKKARVTALKESGIKTREKIKEDDDENDDDKSGESTSSQNRGPLKQQRRETNTSRNDKDGPKKGQSLREYIMAD